MKKIVLLTLLFCIFLITACTQDVKENVAKQDAEETVTTQDVEDKVTKMEKFFSKKGMIFKIIDYELPKIQFKYSSTTVKIQKVISSSMIGYFLQISKKGEYDSITASIAYEDLIEVIKALKTLKLEFSDDVELKADYLENKFITDDGFEIGYYLDNGDYSWFLNLSKYGSGNTVFLNDADKIEVVFNSAKSKIEELKNDVLLKSTE